MNRRTLTSVSRMVLLLLVGLGGALGLHTVADWNFQYAALPATDEGLRLWLAGQPGVERADVWRDGEELHVHFRTRFWRTGPSLGDFTAALQQLGYEGFQKSTATGRTSWGW